MIAFKHPEYLFFLFAITIPIVIHLFSFRKYKKVYFHNLQLIKQIQVEQNSTKSKLKELLILFSRIGMIMFLVFCFAQPFIPHTNPQNQSKNNLIALYIDNSFSSQSETEKGIVLEQEKIVAQQIADAYPTDAKFILLTNKSDGTEQIIRSRDDIKNAITQLSYYSKQEQLQSLINKMQVIASRNEFDVICHIISDFQKSSKFEQISVDSTTTIYFYPIENQLTSNIYIDSCYFENNHHIANQQEKLFVCIQNNSDETFANLPIKLYINDSLRAIATGNLKPQSKTTIPIEYNASTFGIASGKIEIEDYPIMYDNSYFFSYFIENQISILSIFDTKPNPYINALCKNQQDIALTNQQLNTIDYSSLSNYKVIVLDGLSIIPTGIIEHIKKTTNMGKNIVVVPSNNIDVDSYNQFFQYFTNQKITALDTTTTKISHFDKSNSLFKNVFEQNKESIILPDVKIHYQFENQQNNSLIVLQNNDAFLCQFSKNNTNLFVFSTPFDLKYSSFVSSPLFVSLYPIFMSVSSSNELQTTIGKSTELFIQHLSQDNALHLEDASHSIDCIPQYRIDMQNAKLHITPMNQIENAGNYVITQEGNHICGLSYNYDRQESNPEFYSTDELQEICTDIPKSSFIQPNKDITLEIKEIENGKPLWRIALLLSILCIIAEVILIRKK